MSEPTKSSTVIPSPEEEDYIDVLAIGRALWVRRLLILGMVATMGLGSLGVTALMPRVYTAEATILPTGSGDPSASFAAGLASQLGAGAAMLGGLGGMGGGKAADLAEILNSRTMAQRVIDKLSLDKKLTGWKTRGQLVARLRKMVTVVPPSLKVKIIEIKVHAGTPELAAEIADAYLTELKVMLDEIGYNSASKNRRFLERQLVKTKAEMNEAEDKLTKFQADHRLASLPETVVASIKSLSDLEAQRLSAEIELSSTDEALNEFRSRVNSLQADPNTLIELEVKRKTLATQKQALSRAQEAFLSKLSNLPPKGMVLARLQRDAQVQNAIYLALSQQYQTALISEGRDSDAFLPLDHAQIPDRPTSPKRGLNLVLGLLLGMVLGSALALFLNYRESKGRVA